MKICVFGKAWTLTCKLHVKVTFFMKTWNDATVNTNILAYTLSHKPITKVQFLTKVLIFNFPVNNTNSENWKDEFG